MQANKVNKEQALTVFKTLSKDNGQTIPQTEVKNLARELGEEFEDVKINKVFPDLNPLLLKRTELISLFLSLVVLLSLQ